MNLDSIFADLALEPDCRQGGDRAVFTPIDGSEIARVRSDNGASTANKIAHAEAAFAAWRMTPAPRRGELIRLLGEELRAHKEALGRLVSLESGKILQEGMGEVQEMIDICDFAVGLSRQLYGLTIASERPGHRMMETWHPLGVCGVISAFNFPVAVWSWNFALAIVCGDPVVWKPSEKTPLTALACQRLFARAIARFDGELPENLLQILIGGKEVGEALVGDERVALLSATGSCRMGREVAPRVAARFGRSLLELGGNNAMIVAPSADLALAERAVTFSAVGTAGQRCTSLRRMIVHREIRDELVARLKKAYAGVPIGSPLDDGVLLGPLMDKHAFDAMQAALAQARDEGGTITGGERVLADEYPDAYYVTPAIAEMPGQSKIVTEETFAPILYVMEYGGADEAIALHNDVPQGLSSCIFTNDMREAERFLSSEGSDCGIANVNIGPSGAEIGGAFGGEKETGGGRESGGESWKAYMRRASNTINYSPDLPLAQGINFGSD
ncbi:MAG: aldehyde dehydrogenase family protein [Rhodospirillaceae bacterium]|nr:aldehyde dehydrogenase family protein [Rhodospirillaceae bacterium]MBT5677574.1 aldehyde dehydrogenase family protein [Rhodospirillaceae bacterium]MBT6828232.1 aldehyde dehydrogenase family protein [Rhodospirillaceae bacterium]